MFNPSYLDEVCVHSTHLEERGKHFLEEKSEDTFESEEKGKGKFKGKGKNTASIKIEKEKLTCKHCSKDGHDEDHCWKLHPEMRPNKVKNKEKEKTTTTITHDLGYDFEDETKITAMGLKGKDIASTSSSSCLNST